MTFTLFFPAERQHTISFPFETACRHAAKVMSYQGTVTPTDSLFTSLCGVNNKQQYIMLYP